MPAHPKSLLKWVELGYLALKTINCDSQFIFSNKFSMLFTFSNALRSSSQMVI
jgi:hypothetical protein